MNVSRRASEQSDIAESERFHSVSKIMGDPKPLAIAESICVLSWVSLARMDLRRRGSSAVLRRPHAMMRPCVGASSARFNES